MKERVIITDVTRMKEPKVCVAGYLERNYECVRPLPDGYHPEEKWLYVNGKPIIRPFAVVELNLKEKKPSPPHTEDIVADQTYPMNVGTLSPEKQAAFRARFEDASVDSIFGASIHRDEGRGRFSGYVKSGEGTQSLGTIKPKALSEVLYREKDDGKLDYRIAFTDQQSEEYRLAVTDLSFRLFLDHMRSQTGKSFEETSQSLTATLRTANLYLRIGLARGWEKYPDRCYLQITGVYSFPDYLAGCCFADFQTTKSDSHAKARLIHSPTIEQHQVRVKAYSVKAIRSRHANAYAPWSKEDDKRLIEFQGQMKPIKELSEMFGRKPGAIRARLRKLGIVN